MDESIPLFPQRKNTICKLIQSLYYPLFTCGVFNRHSQLRCRLNNIRNDFSTCVEHKSGPVTQVNWPKIPRTQCFKSIWTLPIFRSNPLLQKLIKYEINEGDEALKIFNYFDDLDCESNINHFIFIWTGLNACAPYIEWCLHLG